MTELGDIIGKTFLVTGGASGLGAIYVEELCKEGAKNVVIFDIAEDVGLNTAEQLNKKYSTVVIFVKCDISDEASITDAFNKVVDKFNTVDVIINNAGVMNDTSNVWRKACDVNWQGLVSLTMKGVDHMRKDKGGAGGTIINVSSTAALFITPYFPIYSGSKMAVLYFNMCLGMEPFHEQTGVRLLTICYGPTNTPLLHDLDKRTYEKRLGEDFLEALSKAFLTQSPEWAAQELMKMYRNGAHNTVWSVTNTTPAKDVTQAIRKAFTDIGNVVNDQV